MSSSSSPKVAYLAQLPEALRATFTDYFDEAGVSLPERRSIHGAIETYLDGYLLVGPDEAPLLPPPEPPPPLPAEREQEALDAVSDAIAEFLDAPSPEARAALEQARGRLQLATMLRGASSRSENSLDAEIGAAWLAVATAIETYLETGSGRDAVDTALERAHLLDERAALRRRQAT